MQTLSLHLALTLLVNRKHSIFHRGGKLLILAEVLFGIAHEVVPLVLPVLGVDLLLGLWSLELA